MKPSVLADGFTISLKRTVSACAGTRLGAPTSSQLKGSASFTHPQQMNLILLFEVSP